MREQPRERELGTVVDIPKTPAERITAIRQTVAQGMARKLDGVLLDLT